MSTSRAKIAEAIRDHDLEREALLAAFEAEQAAVETESAFIDEIREIDVTVRPADVVYRAIAEALDVLRAAPDPEGRFLAPLRCHHPDVVPDPDEVAEAFATAVERVRMGEIAVEMLSPGRAKPNARAISRMQVVLTWSRFCVGRHARRDWKIVCMLAEGRPATKIAKAARCSRTTVYDRKEFQLGRIAAGLAAAHPDLDFLRRG